MEERTQTCEAGYLFFTSVLTEGECGKDLTDACGGGGGGGGETDEGKRFKCVLLRDSLKKCSLHCGDLIVMSIRQNRRAAKSFANK